MTRRIDPRSAWEAYEPTSESPWDLKKVGHLYRRAGFGATWPELESGLKAGPQKTIDRLLKGAAPDPEFDDMMAKTRNGLVTGNNGPGATAWWLYRILYGRHPLLEKVTLFWHNHFATSNGKVQNAHFMLTQYDLLQRYALGSFRSMTREMSADPAMMVWLDTSLSKKGKPNENYSRELMELFCLGIGNYTEQDIREAARAFTGWALRTKSDGSREVVFDANQHDDGEKAVLGQRGKWKPDDIVRILLEQKSTPTFIVTKLYQFLISEAEPATPELLAPLAEKYRRSDFDTGDLVATMLRSNLFFSPTAYRSRVKSPVDFALGIVRAMEGRLGTTALAQALEGLGQNLFYPPSVKGWDGGQAWLNGQTLLFRQNLALALCSTEDDRFGRRTDPAALARKYAKQSDAEITDFFLKLFLQDDVPAESRERLAEYQKTARTQAVPVYWTQADAADHRVRTLCHLVLTLPEFQLH
jgi:uncharacterized protein (DUF1800 family)